MNNKQNPLNEANKSRRKIFVGSVGMVATIGLLIAALSTRTKLANASASLGYNQGEKNMSTITADHPNAIRPFRIKVPEEALVSMLRSKEVRANTKVS